jgi:hypothetical protein
LNGSIVGAFAAPDGWQDISIPLPPSTYPATSSIIDFVFDRTLRPSDRDPESTDQRQLALRVDRMWVEPEVASTIDSSVRSLRSKAATMPNGVAASR